MIKKHPIIFWFNFKYDLHTSTVLELQGHWIEELDFVVRWFARNTLGQDQLVQLFTCHPGYVSSFQFFAVGVEKDELWTFTGDLPESCAFEILFKVLVDEFLHLGELIQTSPSARFDPSRMNFRIFAISLKIQVWQFSLKMMTLRIWGFITWSSLAWMSWKESKAKPNIDHKVMVFMLATSVKYWLRSTFFSFWIISFGSTNVSCCWRVTLPGGAAT